ncbi:MAG: cell division protein FtsQ/DivIB, partial [Acutalibacteraceae bacterium]
MKESERDRQNAQTDWQSASDWFTQRQSERINTSGGRYDVNNKREPENKAKAPYRESGRREVNTESRRPKPAAPKKAPEKSRKKDRSGRRLASNKSRNSGKSNDELRLEYAEKTRKHRKRKIIQWFVFTALIFVGIFVAASLTVLFHIEEIKVEGDTRYSIEQIIEASEIEEGDNLWLTSAKEVSARVSTALPYVGSVRLKRSIPSTLTLTVEETSSKYAVKSGKKYVLVDESDKVLEAKASKAGKNIIIEGLKLSKISEGEKLSAESPENYQTAKDVLSCALENEINLEKI